jgi:hypothetical protein
LKTDLRSMSRHLLCLISLVLCFTGCDSGQPGSVPQADYEGDLGEAIVRHLIKNLPDPAPGIPKSHCIVTGKGLDATSMDFARRFADLKLRIISGDVLLVTDPDNSIVDPETRLAPFILQLAFIKSTGPASWTADVGWSYKKTFEKQRFEVMQKDGKYEVLKTERLEGNYQAPAARP